MQGYYIAVILLSWSVIQMLVAENVRNIFAFIKSRKHTPGKNRPRDTICYLRRASGWKTMDTGMKWENYIWKRRITIITRISIPEAYMPKRYMRFAKNTGLPKELNNHINNNPMMETGRGGRNPVLPVFTANHTKEYMFIMKLTKWECTDIWVNFIHAIQQKQFIKQTIMRLAPSISGQSTLLKWLSLLLLFHTFFILYTIFERIFRLY